MTWFLVLTTLFIIVSTVMVLIILVQRAQGGGLAGAFGGAGGTGADTVFGGRVGDALTWATVICFLVYLGLAITLNLIDNESDATAIEAATEAVESVDETPATPTSDGLTVPTTAPAGDS